MTSILSLVIIIPLSSLYATPPKDGVAKQRTFGHYGENSVYRLELVAERDDEIEFVYVSENLRNNTRQWVAGVAKAVHVPLDTPEHSLWQAEEQFPAEQYVFQRGGCILQIFLEAFRGSRAVVVNKGCGQLSGGPSIILRQE